MKKNNDYVLLKQVLASREFGRMYVFFGDEPYLVESCRKSLRKKLVSGPTEDFNYHRFTQENWDLDAFSEAMEALPMLSERSMVEIQDIDFFSFDQQDRERMTALLSDIPDYCTLLFVYDTTAWKPDKRMKKLWGAVEAVSGIFELNKQSERELIPWIRNQMAKSGKQISTDLCRRLILLTGGSMTAISSEIEKLACCTDQPAITKSDIDGIVIPVLEAAIFDITKDIGSRNFDGALAKLQELLRQNTEPISIAAVIGRQLRQMYGAKILTQQGKGPEAVAALYGIMDFAAREVYDQARGYQKSQLRAGMRLCAETDYAMKSSGGDTAALLTDMVLRLAQRESA